MGGWVQGGSLARGHGFGLSAFGGAYWPLPLHVPTLCGSERVLVVWVVVQGGGGGSGAGLLKGALGGTPEGRPVGVRAPGTGEGAGVSRRLSFFALKGASGADDEAFVVLAPGKGARRLHDRSLVSGTRGALTLGNPHPCPRVSGRIVWGIGAVAFRAGAGVAAGVGGSGGTGAAAVGGECQGVGAGAGPDT